MNYSPFPMRRKGTVKLSSQHQLYYIINQIMQISRLVLVLLVLVAAVQTIMFDKEVHSDDAKALCLNGAQSFVYVEAKAKASPEGIIAYFMATPTSIFCGGSSLSNSLDKCVTISDEITSYWTPQITISGGMIDDSAYENWIKVIIPSCDGALFQGYATNVTKYKGKELYFRGNRVLKSNLQHIFHKKYNASKITNFVFAGSGLGATGALIWSRYFYDEIVLSSGKNKQFSLILDSIPFSYNSFKSKSNQYETSLQNLLKVANTEELTPFILCTLRNQGQEWRCFKLEETYFYLNFPILLLDSQYDRISVENVLEISCINRDTNSLGQCSTSERNFLEEYRSSKMVKHYSLVNFHQNSVWSISCSSGPFLDSTRYNDSNWNIDGTIKDNVQSFIAHSRVASINPSAWPSNSACSGQI